MMTNTLARKKTRTLASIPYWTLGLAVLVSYVNMMGLVSEIPLLMNQLGGILSWTPPLLGLVGMALAPKTKHPRLLLGLNFLLLPMTYLTLNIIITIADGII